MDDDLRELMANVPGPFATRFAELADLIDAFCNAHLTDEYRQLCREMAAVVCQNAPSVLRGKPGGWAAGIVYAFRPFRVARKGDGVFRIRLRAKATL